MCRFQNMMVFQSCVEWREDILVGSFFFTTLSRKVMFGGCAQKWGDESGKRG